VIARPAGTGERIAIDDPARGGIGEEQRLGIALDAGVGEERAEDLGAAGEAERKGAGEITDVAVALNEVGAAAIARGGAAAGRHHLGDRDEPDAAVAEKRGGGGPRRGVVGFGRGRRRRSRCGRGRGLRRGGRGVDHARQRHTERME